MYFKYIILIIPFFLATNSVMGNLDEDLQNAYDFARKIYYAPQGEGLKSFDMINFVGYAKYELVENYFKLYKIKPKDQENINFELFTIIIKDFCKAYRYEICKYLNDRIEDLKLQVQECEDLYEMVKRQYTASSGKNLTDSNLIEFFGNKYKPIIKECLEKYNVLDPKNVDLELFTSIVRAVCKSERFFEKQFLETSLKEVKGKAVQEEEEEEEEEDEEEEDEEEEE